MFIIFDTETSGFPSSKKHAKDQAWICQLTVAIYDEEGELAEYVDSYIKPEGRQIHPGAQKAHGLSVEFLADCGEDERIAITNMNALISDHAGMIHAAVAHNIDFDMPMINYAAARTHQPNTLLNFPQFCTMKNTVDLCQLPFARRSYGTQKYKWPKLEELYKFLHGTQMEGAHNSFHDVAGTAACFFTPQLRDIYINYMRGNS